MIYFRFTPNSYVENTRTNQFRIFADSLQLVCLPFSLLACFEDLLILLIITRTSWCPRTGKGQRLMFKEAVSEYI